MAKENLEIRKLENTNIAIAINNVGNSASTLLTVEEVENLIKRGGGYGYKEYVDGNPWSQLKQDIGEEKTKKIIKLYCKINGVDYEQYGIVNESIKVAAYDFELFVRETIEKKISVKIKL